MFFLISDCDTSRAEIQIKAKPEFKAKIIEALEFMKKKSPSHYRMVNDYVVEIIEDPRSGAQVKAKVVKLSQRSCPDVYWCSSVIYHEAAHMMLYEEGKEHSGYKGERAANKLQLKYLYRVKAPKYMKDHLKVWIQKGNHFDLDGDGDYDWDDYYLRDY